MKFTWRGFLGAAVAGALSCLPAVASDQFTYVAAPTVSGVSPSSGPTAGGTSVTITGTGFISGATVAFGATAATGVTVVSGTEITATSPAESAATVNVTVTTTGGTSATSSADQFTSSTDPTAGLLPAPSDGYANWSTVGLNAIPLTASITGSSGTTATLNVTTSYSGALGPSQLISGAGVPTGATITAMSPTGSLTGTGNIGTYSISCTSTCSNVSSEAMTASGIPNRSTIYKTLTACNPTATTSTCDDTSAINSALSACPAGEVVLLNTGVWQINGNGVVLSTSRCTLRGSGPGSQLNTGLNVVTANEGSNAFREGCTAGSGGSSTAIWCRDPTATQLIKMDRATNTNYGVLYVYSNGLGLGKSYNLASDAVQGAYSVTLSSAPSDVHVGDIVDVDENADKDPNVYWGNNNAPPGGSRDWFSFRNRQDRTLT